jgi:integrase
MSRPREPIIVRPRGSRPGSWRVWLRPECGLPPDVCAEWTERSLRTAPPLFLARVKWPRTQAAADRVGLALVEYLLEHGSAPRDQGPAVEDYAGLFRSVETSPRARRLAAQGRAYSPNTVELYRATINLRILPDKDLCRLRMGEVRRVDLEAYFARLYAELGASRAMQLAWTIIHFIFAQWADDSGRPSPFAGMPKPSYQETIRGSLTEAELVKIFAAPWPSPMDRIICALTFWAGLRRGEVLALRWSDVDLPRRRIVVQRAAKSLDRKTPLEGTPKSGKSRIVPIVAEVDAALRGMPRFVEALAAEGDEARAMAAIGEEYVVVYPPGHFDHRSGRKQLRPGKPGWYTAMHGAMDRAGIDRAGRDITPHSARHSIASVMLARGVPKEIIKAILGHFDERTTDGYLHIAAEEIDKAGKGI